MDLEDELKEVLSKHLPEYSVLLETHLHDVEMNGAYASILRINIDCTKLIKTTEDENE